MKAMNRKSLGVLGLCALLAASLAACGSGKVGSDVSSAVSKAGSAISSTASKAGSKLEDAMDPDSSSHVSSGLESGRDAGSHLDSSGLESTKDISSRPDSDVSK